MSSKFEDLPFDILINIFNKLDYKDWSNLSKVNKKLNVIANDDFFWKTKLFNDIHKWKVIGSKTYPKDLFFPSDNEPTKEISFKSVYLRSCPDLLTNKEILKKLETFQNLQNTLHLTSTSEESLNLSNYGCSNSLTLSSLSSIPMPHMFFGQIREFINKNVFNSNQAQNESALFQSDSDSLQKLVMFGPGLETTTSCLVTNILWKSEFKTIGMVPGKDGYGSGIKLKLFNHKPFNLTILYTNVSKIRNTNDHNINQNKLLSIRTDYELNEVSYELQPQVNDACSDATAFVYVIDNNLLSCLDDNLDQLESYKLELNVLMRETRKDLPLLILSCNTNISGTTNECDPKIKGLSCAQIVEKLELYKLDREWQIRNCELFQHKMKDIVSGFEWILNKLDERYLSNKIKSLNCQSH